MTKWRVATDKEKEDMRKIVDTCNMKVKDLGVCKEILLPCGAVLRSGRCPELAKYIKNKGVKND